jgi:hypothetical protein
MRDDEQIIQCWRCGIEIDADTYWKRIKRQTPNPDECRDCKDTSAKHKGKYRWIHPVLGQLSCNPYKGDLDDDWNPITKDGRLYMPGDRICGLKDCVRASHVKPRVMLVADPIETILALAEAQSYSPKGTPPRANLEGATE